MGIGEFLKNIFSQATEKSIIAEESEHTSELKEADALNDTNPVRKGKEPGSDDIIAIAYSQIPDKTYWYNIKATDCPIFLDTISKLTNPEKVAFIVQQIQNIENWKESLKNNFQPELSKKSQIAKTFIDQLFRSKFELTEGDINNLVAAFIRCKPLYGGEHLLSWPIKNLLSIVQKKYNGKVLPNDARNALLFVKTDLLENKNVYYEKRSAKVIELIDAIIFESKDNTAIKPILFLGEDDFAAYANQLIRTLPDAEKPYWYKLIALCQKAGGATPSKKLLTDGHVIIRELGDEKFKAMVKAWFSFIVKLKEKQVAHPYLIQYLFITSVNVECLKGFIWLCTNLADLALSQQIAAMADRAYRKIPGHGQTCTAIGNACAFTLYKTAGLDGINHLSRLKLRVKQLNTQTLIEKYLAQAAAERNIAADAIEDLAVDDFDLVDGAFKIVMEGFTATISIEKVGKVNLVWQKADGTAQKSDPAIVKEKCADELKQLKADIKQIEASLGTQRDRLDRSLRADRKMSWPHFHQYYFQHGLASFIARKMIWRFTRGEAFFDVLYLDGEWKSATGERFEPADGDTISLWHPALDSLENVQRWRLLLIDKQLQQPVKQAFREIYLLTDAEINTRTYSNRMAGHILKHHQLNSLAKGRSWRYALQGSFDGGSEGTAQLILPEYNLVAEYWTNGMDEGINDTWIFRYVSIDQVRFKNLKTNAAVQLVDVPVLAFSEAMRDVDLFVGVASVGNDPTWRDSGELPGYREYWQNSAFGDLNEMSKGRKQILERLLPRLKIAKIAHLTDKFLVVKGKKRTYKIHMGSTNILMEPNDQYLCIVPDRTQKNVTENVFLPFEGDNGLSIILSKAFLLADDDKITDATITRQIDR